MLKRLIVKNFAIIDNIQIDFKSGFTVLTGETGAGKSLIIDAISLLFGERASNDMIRFNETKAQIEGFFTNINNEVYQLLDTYDIEYSIDDFLIIKREIFDTGKSICKINNQTITLSQLKELGLLLGDIHSQLDTFSLVNPKNYLKYLTDCNIEELLKEYSVSFKEYKKVKKEYDNLYELSSTGTEKIGYLKYQIDELNKASLSIDEETELKKKAKFLENSEDIMRLKTSLKDIFNGECLNNLYEALNILEKLKEYDKNYDEIFNTVQDAYYGLDDISSSKLLDTSIDDYDDNLLEQINERLSVYSTFKRKYNKQNTNDLLKYFDDLKNELNSIENYDERLNELSDSVQKAYQKTLMIATNIHDLRVKNAKVLSNDIINHLHDLQLLNTKFEIAFNDISNPVFLKDGIDNIDFYVSFNKGEPLKQLSKTASGGELSRFMLALKALTCNNTDSHTKIFDEIDSGVSGTIAYSIANKLKLISSNSQVLCITHLPQVAATADTHLYISKHVENNLTSTKIEELDIDGKIYEIASMISNGTPSNKSLEYAKELIKSE